ncbi:hypothetical protein HDV00_002805 [Rhizophlyctis rosea]|nr:hypothetical protein HDV00_002805 [Rhizophlyctis rosea]
MDEDYATALALQLAEYEDHEAAGSSSRSYGQAQAGNNDAAIAMMLQAEEFRKAYDPPPAALTARSQDGRNYLRFRSGAVLQTYVKGDSDWQEHNGVKLPYVCFEELVHHRDLEAVLLTSFATSPEWLDTVIPAPIPVTYVCHSETKEGTFPRYDRPNSTWIFPDKGYKKELYKCFHPKVLILRFRGADGVLDGKTFLRVVISSGNMIPEDYSCVENVLFVQDFPLLAPDQQHTYTSKLAYEFPRYLSGFLAAIDVPKDPWISLLAKYDYSRVRDNTLKSLGGQWSHLIPESPVFVPLSSSDCSTREEGEPEASESSESFDMNFQYQTSSLGDLTLTSWLRSFCYLAAGRNEPSRKYAEGDRKRRKPTSANKQRKKKRVQVQRDEGFDLGIDEFLDPPSPPADNTPPPFTLPITVVYPTEKHIMDMVQRGVVGGGTMMKEDQWEKPNFPKSCLRACRSKRVAFIHCNVLLGKYVERDRKEGGGVVVGDVDETDFRRSGRGYIYVGSHNFSLSAWGTVSTPPRTEEDTTDSDATDDGSGLAHGRVLNRSIRMMNCELGVVLEVGEDGVIVGEEDRGCDIPWLDGGLGSRLGSGDADGDDGKGDRCTVKIPVEAVLMHAPAKVYEADDVPWMPEKWRRENCKDEVDEVGSEDGHDERLENMVYGIGFSAWDLEPPDPWEKEGF